MAHSKHMQRFVRPAHQPRQISAWLAVLALLVQVLLPFGQALALGPSQDIEYQIICTANGVKQIPINGDGTPIDAQDAAPCPFCFTYAAPSLLQPETNTFILDSQSDKTVSYAISANDQHTSIWRGTPRPSRAPPLSI